MNNTVDVFPRTPTPDPVSTRATAANADTYEQACLNLFSNHVSDLACIPTLHLVKSHSEGLTPKVCSMLAEVMAAFQPWATEDGMADPRKYLIWTRYLEACLLVKDFRCLTAGSTARHMEKVIKDRCQLLRDQKFFGLYALLCDLRLIWAIRADKLTVDPKPDTPADSAAFKLRRAIQQLNRGATTIKQCLQEHSKPVNNPAPHFNTQLHDTGTTEAPRLCPSTPTPAPTLPPGPSLQEQLQHPAQRSQAITLLTNLLRRLDTTKGTGPDGISNTFISAFLRLDNFRGVESLLEILLLHDSFFGSVDVPPMIQSLAHTIGFAFEKPNKPGRHRIIDIGTWVHSLYQRFVTTWHKSDIKQYLEPHQLGISSGGPEALAQLALSPDAYTDSNGTNDILTILTDIKQCYPDTDATVSTNIIANNLPKLVRLARSGFTPSVIHCRNFTTDTTTLIRRRNALGQGRPASAVLAGVVVADLVKSVDSALDTYRQQGRHVAISSCADNIVVTAHYTLAPAVVHLLHVEAKRRLYRLDDWAFLPFGSPSNRDTIQTYLTTTTSPTYGTTPETQQYAPMFQTWQPTSQTTTGVFRRLDIAVTSANTDNGEHQKPPLVMGVPIFCPRYDTDSFTAYANDTIDTHNAFINQLVNFHNDSINLSHGEHSELAPSQTVTQIAFAGLKSLQLRYNMIAMSLPFGAQNNDNEGTADIGDFSMTTNLLGALDASTLTAAMCLLRLNTTTTPPTIYNRVRRALIRSPNTGGCGITSLSDNQPAASLCSRVRCIQHLYPLCSNQDKRIVQYSIAIITRSANSLVDTHKDLADQLDSLDTDLVATLPRPHCSASSTPTSRTLQPLEHYITKLLAEPNECPDFESLPRQSQLLHPLYRLGMLKEYYTTPGNDAQAYWPLLWDQRRIDAHLRTSTTHNLAANAATLWSLQQRKRDPFTRKLHPYSVSNQHFQIAARVFFGIGMDGLLLNSTNSMPSTETSCTDPHCHKPVDANGIHLLHSCCHLKAARSRRHNRLQSQCKHLLAHTDLVVSDYTPSTTQHQDNHRSFADLEIYDTTTRSALIIDFTVAAPFTKESYTLAPKARDISHGPPQAYYVAAHRRTQKIIAKQPGCAPTPFMPFVTTCTGAFVPHDTTRNSDEFNSEASKVFGTPLTQQSFGGRVNSRPRSPEEALLRRWSRRAAQHTGTFDATLSPQHASSIIVSHYYKRIHHAVTIAHVDGILHGITANRLRLNLTMTF